MKGMANFILQLPDEIPVLIQTSLGRLVELMRFWRACLSDERLASGTNDLKQSDPGNEIMPNPKISSHQQSGVTTQFHVSEMDAIGLIFLCSVEPPIRLTALELLRCVWALRNDIRDLSTTGPSDSLLKNEMDPILIIDVLEENGSTTSNRWARCLSELGKYAGDVCPNSVQEARFEVMQRLANITPIELGGKAHQSLDNERKLEQWLLYSMFACSCPPVNRESGFATTKEIFHLIFPSLKSGSDALTVCAS